MPDTIWVLIMGLGLALFFLVLGVQIRFYEAYGLISGYNTAPPEEQARYDIKGLGDHLGNGLLNLAVLIAGATVAVVLDSSTWAMVLMGLVVAVSFIMVVGGQKFLPRNQGPDAANRPAQHSFLKGLVPERAFLAMKAGTREWLLECPCGHKRDYWDAGGVRHKGFGEPRKLWACPVCERVRWHKIRRKKPGELEALRIFTS